MNRPNVVAIHLMFYKQIRVFTTKLSMKLTKSQNKYKYFVSRLFSIIENISPYKFLGEKSVRKSDLLIDSVTGQEWNSADNIVVGVFFYTMES